MLQPTSLVHDGAAAVPTKVAAAGSDNVQGTSQHAHNSRAHACVPDPLPTRPLLVEDDQEHRAHDLTVKTPTVGTTVTNQLSDKCESNVRHLATSASPGIFLNPASAACQQLVHHTCRCTLCFMLLPLMQDMTSNSTFNSKSSFMHVSL